MRDKLIQRGIEGEKEIKKVIVHNRYKNDYLVRRDEKRDRSIDIDIKIEKALI